MIPQPRTALVLAAHGSHVSPDTNALVRQYANQLSRLGRFDEVTPAFYHGTPAFGEVLDQLSASEITVIPLMAARGYFSDVVLPRDLKKNARYKEVSVFQTDPVGTHRGIAALVAGRVRDRLREHRLDPKATTVAIVGHGTRRHSHSALTTIELANALRKSRLVCDVIHAFLDEDPGVESILDRATQTNVVIVPFLIAAGPHATQDIPRRLGLGMSPKKNPPFSGRVGRRFLVYDTPIGTDAGFFKIIADM